MRDKFGRVIGMIVFALGTAILFFVLYAAYQMFALPAAELFHENGSAGSPLTAVGLGTIIAWILVRIVLLFVMTLAGSIIASKGIQLYLGCTSAQATREPVKIE